MSEREPKPEPKPAPKRGKLKLFKPVVEYARSQESAEDDQKTCAPKESIR